MNASPILCGKPFDGKNGLGGVRRCCCRLYGHTKKCHDMPFLADLRGNHPKVADKIERDSFQTRGASWGKPIKGNPKRKNRQPRWTVTADTRSILHTTKSTKTGFRSPLN